MGELNAEQQQAQRLIESVDAGLSLIATQIERPADPLLIVEIRDDRHVRVYGPGSLEDMTLTKLGLENAWKGRTNDWGFSTLTIPEAFQLEGKVILLRSNYSQDLPDSTLPVLGCEADCWWSEGRPQEERQTLTHQVGQAPRRAIETSEDHFSIVSSDSLLLQVVEKLQEELHSPKRVEENLPA